MRGCSSSDRPEITRRWVFYSHPGEWPWNYVFLAMINVLFFIYAAGRSLGVDSTPLDILTGKRSVSLLQNCWRSGVAGVAQH